MEPNSGRENAGQRPSNVRSDYLAVVATVVVVVLFLVARKTHAFVDPQLYAEDGLVFLNHHLEYGVHALFVPNTGYYHLIPRLIAYLAGMVPTVFTPAIYNYAAVLFSVAVAAQACFVFLRLGMSRWWSPLMGIALAVVPHTGEVFVSLTNLQWFGSIALVLLLIEPSQTCGWGTVARTISAFLLGMTGPFSLFLSPLFIARALVDRTCARIVVASVVAGCGVIQASEMGWLFQQVDVPGSFSLLATVDGLFERTLGNLFVASAFAAWAQWMVVVLALVVLVRGFVRDHRRSDAEALIWLLLACFSLLVPVAYKFRFHMERLDGMNGDRYFFVAKVLLVWTVILLARGQWTQWQPKVAFVVLVICLTASTATRFKAPKWEHLEWGKYADAIDRQEAVVIPIQPKGMYFDYRGRAHRRQR